MKVLSQMKLSAAFGAFILGMSFHSVVFAETYTLTFTGTWGPADIETDYPSSAHFSEMIGVSHTAGAELWKNGELASPGVELVAEIGIIDNLVDEIVTAQEAGNAGRLFVLDSLFGLPNSVSAEIEVDRDKPFVSMITMIAPSPDWFIGVSGLSLLNGGEWVRSLTVELRPYDAGTEDGEGFFLSNPATSPPQPISRLDGSSSPFIGRPVIGTLKFVLKNPPPESAPEPVMPNRGAHVPAVNSLLLP